MTLRVILGGPKLEREAAAARLGLVTKFATIRANYGASDIQPQTGRLRSRLKGHEQIIRIRHATARVPKPDNHQIVL
jgi:hypothetical protein